MAEISPFQGIRFNQDIIKDMSTVICPPYDIISPEEQQGYYQRERLQYYPPGIWNGA